jgi:hypothetical protein
MQWVLLYTDRKMYASMEDINTKECGHISTPASDLNPTPQYTESLTTSQLAYKFCYH